MSRAVAWGARFVLLAIGGAAALLGTAMHLYPGGTVFDPHARGHAFWRNFLCDLTDQTARNGMPSPVSAPVARGGMLLLSLALGVSWLIVPVFLADQPRAARTVRASGAGCVAGLLIVPFTQGATHVVTIYVSATAGLTAGLVTLAALVRGRGPARHWAPLAAMLAATAADSVFYAQAVAARPRMVVPSLALPLFQRLACLLAVTWMSATAAEILWLGRSPSAKRRAV
jgi:hypothetical protein